MYDTYTKDRPGPHWGDYQFGVSHDHEQLSQDPMLPAVNAQAVPKLGQLAAPEVRGGLTYVRSDLRSSLLQALQFTEYQPASSGAVSYGYALPSLSGIGSNWVQQAVASGQAVLINLQVAQSQSIAQIALTADPNALLELAGARGESPGSWAILDGPPQLLQAVGPAPAVAPAPAPAPAAAAVDTPSWVVPVVVGGLGIAALVFIVSVGKKKRR